MTPTRRTRSSHLRAFGAIALCAAVGLSACTTTDAGKVVRADIARAAATPAEAADGGRVVRSMAGTLLAPVQGEHADGNLAYSPASITLALAQLRAGVQGESARQLDDLFGAEAYNLAASMNATSLMLDNLNGKVVSADKRTIELSNANALWAQEGVTWNKPFLSTLAKNYGTGVHTLDFATDPDRARKAVNGWVSDRTREKIPELVPDGVINTNTLFVMTNALYFKAPWADPFVRVDDGAFTTPTGREQVGRMQDESFRPYLHGDGWQSVRIPYAGGKLAMVLIVPDAGKLEAVGRQLADESTMRTMLESGDATSVDLTMPLFDLDTKTPLNEVLKAVGVVAPFDPPADDFAPMSDDPLMADVRVADVRHQATVTVDEQGTEAAAATSIVAEPSSARPSSDPVELVVDRPFYFAITTVADTVPLFVGRVNDPAKT